MLHIVYTNNLILKNSNFQNSYADAIDIDTSTNVKITNINVDNAENDCVDFMQTVATISNSKFSNCGDKGLSVGERSNITMNNITISNSKTGLVSKDDSIIKIYDSFIYNNELGMDALKKNWQYGTGGKILTNNIKFNKNFIKIQTDKFSSINEY